MARMGLYNAAGDVRIVWDLEGEDLETWTQFTLPNNYDDRGWRWDNENHVFVRDWTIVDAELHAQIDAAAGDYRQLFITTAPGQEMTYLNKEREARAFLAGEPAGPMITAEAEGRGIPVEALAGEVVANADAWADLGGRIEGCRLAAKAAVSSATTLNAKIAAAVVIWPLPSVA